MTEYVKFINSEKLYKIINTYIDGTVKLVNKDNIKDNFKMNSFELIQNLSEGKVEMV